MDTSTYRSNEETSYDRAQLSRARILGALLGGVIGVAIVMIVFTCIACWPRHRRIIGRKKALASKSLKNSKPRTRSIPVRTRQSTGPEIRHLTALEVGAAGHGASNKSTVPGQASKVKSNVGKASKPSPRRADTLRVSLRPLPGPPRPAPRQPASPPYMRNPLEHSIPESQRTPKTPSKPSPLVSARPQQQSPGFMRNLLETLRFQSTPAKDSESESERFAPSPPIWGASPVRVPQKRSQMQRLFGGSEKVEDRQPNTDQQRARLSDVFRSLPDASRPAEPAIPAPPQAAQRSPSKGSPRVPLRSSPASHAPPGTPQSDLSEPKAFAPSAPASGGQPEIRPWPPHPRQ